MKWGIKLFALIRRWKAEQRGMAVMETAMLFPVLLVMLLGVYDVGHAITVNHKMITASNVAADLLTRKQAVSGEDINQAIIAAGLAMNPYADENSIGIDIISVQYDENDDPVVLWRETRNMGDGLEAGAASRTYGLGTTGEGALMVTVLYDYVPTFGSIVIEAFRMREVAFSRGRRSSVVTRN